MCGIGGIRRFGPEPITADQIRTLICANENRGNDASGVCLQDSNGKTHVLKKNLPAWKFVTSEEYNAFIDTFLQEDTLIALVHTRAATLGDPIDPRNNHPLWNGHAAVVHNGMLSNHAELFRRHGIDRVGEVDSDILRGILDKFGMTKKGVSMLKDVAGSCAIAAVHEDFPGKLILGRSGSPLVLASTPNQLIWASTKAAIHLTMRPWEIRFGFPMSPNRVDLAWMTVSDDSIYLLGEMSEKAMGDGENAYRYMDAIEWRDTFKTCQYYNTPKYNIHETFFGRRLQSGTKIKIDSTFCETCKLWVTIDEKLQNRPIWTLHCTKCKELLAPAPKGYRVKKRKIDIIQAAGQVC